MGGCQAAGETREKDMIGRLNHVAIAVRDIAKARALFRAAEEAVRFAGRAGRAQ